MQKTPFATLLLLCLCLCPWGFAQSLGNAGTIQGTVTDPSGAVIPGAAVTVRNAVTAYTQTVSTGADGTFRLLNIPPGSHRLEITATGFGPFSQTVEIRSAVPVQIKATLTLGQATTTVTVQGAAEAIENIPTDHVDVDQTQLSKLPVSDPAGGLSEAITYSTGGVAADANGFFHPLGDHAQVSFVIDGQPISDQQSKVFSTQLPTSAIQSMEVTTGSPAAEFGDKSSLMAQITTRSGLGAGKVFGNVDATYGKFGTEGGDVALGYGTAKWGNFIALDGLRTGRFLDAPEFTAFHDKGNNQTIFDRFDFQPTGTDVFHLNLFTARNWFQIPNDYDQLGQDQRQRVLTWNIAPGYQHTFSTHTLLTINPYIRKDQLNYYPSRDPFADTPATQNESRQLLNWGVRADIAMATGHHNLKYGVDLKQTRLLENFGFGVTDPAFNSPCIDATGVSVAGHGADQPCAVRGGGISAEYERESERGESVPAGPAALRSDARRAAVQFSRHGQHQPVRVLRAGCDQLGQFRVFARLPAGPVRRADLGDRAATAAGHRLQHQEDGDGAARLRTRARSRRRSTRICCFRTRRERAGWRRTCSGPTAAPMQPGFRNQFNTGFQQAMGKYLMLDADYFWKYTHNAYDFNTLLNTTITFPIAWHNSKLDGVTGRREHHQHARLPGLLDFRTHPRALLSAGRRAG